MIYINTFNILIKKYGVDSTDPDNTFGRIFLDQPIVQHGVANTLYFARISSYRPEDLRLPKYQAIPHANSVVVINKMMLGESSLLMFKLTVWEEMK